jgi:hypothetical protein
MKVEERIEELRNARGSLYRVRMATGYNDLGQEGVAEIVIAENMAHRAIERARGKKLGPVPKAIRDMRRELEEAD